MGLYENLRSEPVSGLATRTVIVSRADSTVREACRRMRDAELGCMIVVDDAGLPIGMFNEKLLIRLLAERPWAMDEPVSEAMTRNLTTLPRDAPIAELIETMQHRRLRWVCLVDGAGRAAALTGLRGVMEYVVDHFPRFVKVEPIQTNLGMKTREGA